MDERLMNAMLELDDRHWWYRGRRRIIRAELDRLPLPAERARARRGLWLGPDARRARVRTARCSESSSTRVRPMSLERAAAVRCMVGRLEELPWEDGSFDLITCLDVIEHTPDDRVTLRELRRVSRPGGYLLVTVPAYQGLWSTHDVANHHYRRYSRSRLRAAARRRRLAGRRG